MDKEKYWHKNIETVFREPIIVNLRDLNNCEDYLNEAANRVEGPFSSHILILRIF